MTDMQRLERKVDLLTDMVRQLVSDRYPKYIGTKQACTILGIGRTKFLERLAAGDYPFAFKDQTGHWRISLNDLYRFCNQA